MPRKNVRGDSGNVRHNALLFFVCRGWFWAVPQFNGLIFHVFIAFVGELRQASAGFLAAAVILGRIDSR